MLRATILFLLLYVFVPLWQVNRAQSVFQISTEPSPAQFTQGQPKLFNGPEGGFLVTWADFRDGLGATYAQLYDDLGQAVNANFKIFSDRAVAVAPDGSILVFGYRFELQAIEYYRRGYTQLFSPTGVLKDPFQVTEFLVPPDFVGCPDFGTDLSAYSTGYLLADAYNGALKLLAVDLAGNVTYTAPDASLPEPGSILGSTMASAPDGSYVLFWQGGDPGYLTNGGLFARFFSSTHEIIRDSLLVADGLNPCEIGYSMRAVTLPDSLYELFFTTSDTLWYFVSNVTGEPVQTLQYLEPNRPPQVPEDAGTISSQFAVSNPIADIFSLFITQHYLFRNESGNFSTLRQTTIQDFDQTGKPVGDARNYEVFLGLFDNVRKGAESQFQWPLARHNDIYLFTFEDVTIVDSVKVNDDSVGANQRNPAAIAALNGDFLVLWSDEVQERARMVAPDGNLLGSEFEVDFNEGHFFPSGDFLTFRKEQDEEEVRLSYRIYSPDWQLVQDQTLARRQLSSAALLNADAAVIDDDIFITLLQDSTELELVKISKSQGVLQRRLVDQGDFFSPIEIAADGDGIYWVRWQDNLRGFNSNLKGVSSRFDFHTTGSNRVAFLPGGRLAYLYRESHNVDETGFHLVVRDTAAVDTVGDVKFAGYLASDVRLTSFDLAYFLVTWVEDQRLRTQSFGQDGNALIEPIEVYSSDLTRGLQAVSAVAGSKVLYAWSDVQKPGRGFDISGRLFDKKTITEVRSISRPIGSFVLHQNYPNPFNPETTIEYELAGAGQVQLNIYNLLGQRVRTLVDEWQPAGSFKVSWNGRSEAGASRVASGVYVYELKVNQTVLRKKMVLLH